VPIAEGDTHIHEYMCTHDLFILTHIISHIVSHIISCIVNLTVLNRYTIMRNAYHFTRTKTHTCTHTHPRTCKHTHTQTRTHTHTHFWALPVEHRHGSLTQYLQVDVVCTSTAEPWLRRQSDSPPSSKVHGRTLFCHSDFEGARLGSSSPIV